MNRCPVQAKGYGAVSLPEDRRSSGSTCGEEIANLTVERLGREDGELVEQIVWNNLRYEGPRLACPKLDPALIARLVEEDVRIREDLGENLREENGRWLGAVWPVAATVLVPQ